MRNRRRDISHIILYLSIAIAILYFVISILEINKKVKFKNLEINNFKNNFKIKRNVILEAKSFVIIDLQNDKILAAKNENEALPLASLSKVISIGAFLDFYKNGKLKIPVDTLNAINKILIESDNENLEKLGQKFQQQNKINLLDTINLYLIKNKIDTNKLKISNLTGLDIDDKKASNFGSALDFAKIYAQIYNDEKDIFENTKFENINQKQEILKNTNPTAENTFGLLSSKTGFTDLAGGNLAVIVSPAPGEKYMIVVLGSSKEGRFEDVKKINDLLPLLIKSK